MKIISILLLSALSLVAFKADENKVYLMNQAGNISFFSSTPVEDITAVNHKCSSLLKTKDGSIKVKIPIKTFEFEKDLMYQHFLEKKYMWAEKYPEAIYEGKIVNLDEIDFNTNGNYNARVEGTLDLRGVKQEYSLEGEIIISGDQLSCKTVFIIPLENHKITRPKIVTENIAEEIEVTAELNYEIYSKD